MQNEYTFAIAKAISRVSAIVYLLLLRRLKHGQLFDMAGAATVYRVLELRSIVERAFSAVCDVQSTRWDPASSPPFSSSEYGKSRSALASAAAQRSQIP
jgi:hypothetical protein